MSSFPAFLGDWHVIHFLNGGYLNVSADIESDGSASDVDTRGNSWDFMLDMNSSLVDDAVQQWAQPNDYTITP
jgi:hypothetical protein